ncbi:MAG: plasmid pRiA4b ORF-3 family protein [Chloroflexota bacterium]
MVYQLKVTLRESKPLIWRRVQVPGNVTLHKLHMILQAVMGWTNSHLYSFDIAGTEYSIPDPIEDDFNEFHFVDSRRTRLSKVVSREKVRFSYEYDFGDSWEHDILVEKILPAEPGVQYPLCLAGKRACPPEDCGGVWGYVDLLKIIRAPTHIEYERMMEWLGGPFDPEEFNIDEINRSLAYFRQMGKPRRSDIPEVFRQAFESEDEL